MSNLFKRILSSIVLLPIILFCIWKGELYLQLLLLSCASLATFEWLKLCIKAPTSFFIRNLLFIFGLIYILVALWGFYQLSFLSQKLNFPHYSLQLLVIIVVTLTDTFAFFTGKTLKGPKLAPAISPNKTWSGSIGGIIASILFAVITLFFNEFSFETDNNFSFIFIGACICISMIGQIGDLLESYVKRQFNVKDSGKLIPGHGGILDRADSILAVSFFFGVSFILLMNL